MFPSETSDAAQCLVTGYFRASDPPGVLTSISKDPAAAAGAAADQRQEEKLCHAKSCLSGRTVLISFFFYSDFIAFSTFDFALARSVCPS